MSGDGSAPMWSTGSGSTGGSRSSSPPIPSSCAGSTSRRSTCCGSNRAPGCGSTARFHLGRGPPPPSRAPPGDAHRPGRQPADKVRLLARWPRCGGAPRPTCCAGPTAPRGRGSADAGFSDAMVERLFRPLFAGIQLDPDLEVSRRRFDIVLRMLAAATAPCPPGGWARCPRHRRPLAAGRAAGSTRSPASTGPRRGSPAASPSPAEPSSSPPRARPPPGCSAWPDPGSRPVAGLWFAADEAPLRGPVLVLDGDASGPARNLAVMSEVAPTYAPPGRPCSWPPSRAPTRSIPGLVDRVRRQLRAWFRTGLLELLRTDVIRHGQPDQRPPLRLGARPSAWATAATCAATTATRRRSRARSSRAGAPPRRCSADLRPT